MPALDDIALLAHLVGFDTTSSRSNLELVDFVSDYLDRPGVRVERQLAPDQPKANLVVEVGPQVDPDTRAGLTLSGHTDVVPALEPEWETDPFELTERRGALHGRGSADMKGFLALAINTAREVDPSSLHHPLVLHMTYDEELGTLGARQFYEAWPEDRPLPRAALIGEPTELAPARVHKGHLKVRITVSGTPAHSAYPHLGHNAIEPAARLVEALGRLREELAAERLTSSPLFPEVPFPSLNVGCIHGGVAVNVVPERCEVDLGVRLLPGLDERQVEARIEEAAADALTGERWELAVLSVSPPVESAPDGRLFRALAASFPPEDPPAVSFATDAGWLQRMDHECVVWGPGSIKVAHKPNEWVPRADLARARPGLSELVQQFCVATSPKGVDRLRPLG